MLQNVTWDSWGGPKATGTGTGYHSGADAKPGKAAVVAFKLGMCKGQQMYQAITWYFPQDGESFNSSRYINICTGDYVG